MKNKKAFFTTKWISYTAMMTALVVATAYIPPITILPLTGGIYWCDGAIFIAAYLLDPLAAFIAGGIGTFLYDLIHGNAVMMCASLVIHGLQAAMVSALLHFVLPEKFKNTEWVKALIYSVVGAVIVILGYFCFYWGVAPLLLHDRDYGLAYAAVRIPRNVIQEVIGIAVAMIVCYATTFKKQLKKSRLLPDFKAEVLSKSDQPATDNPS